MEGSGSVQMITDPDPEGPTTHGFGTPFDMLEKNCKKDGLDDWTPCLWPRKP